MYHSTSDLLLATGLLSPWVSHSTPSHLHTRLSIPADPLEYAGGVHHCALLRREEGPLVRVVFEAGFGDHRRHVGVIEETEAGINLLDDVRSEEELTAVFTGYVSAFEPLEAPCLALEDLASDRGIELDMDCEV